MLDVSHSIKNHWTLRSFIYEIFCKYKEILFYKAIGYTHRQRYLVGPRLERHSWLLSTDQTPPYPIQLKVRVNGHCAMELRFRIFLAYVKSQRFPVLNQHALSSATSLSNTLGISPCTSRFQLFRQSHFFAVALRITNFIVLKVSANILFFVLGVTSGSHAESFICVPSMLIRFVIWGFPDTVDADVFRYMKWSLYERSFISESLWFMYYLWPTEISGS